MSARDGNPAVLRLPMFFERTFWKHIGMPVLPGTHAPGTFRHGLVLDLSFVDKDALFF